MVASVLAAAGEEPAVATGVLRLPSLSGWPRFMRPAGPLYALVELQPYVGQFGAPADYKRADSGSGIGVVAGYRVPMGGAKALGIEILYERSGHTNEASDVDAGATRLGAGVRLNLRMDERVSAFALVGGGLYALEFDRLDPGFDLHGPGVFFGGGVDFTPGGRATLRAGAVLHVWDAAQKDGSGGAAETLGLNLGAAVSF
jgi:hypothetical protein